MRKPLSRLCAALAVVLALRSMGAARSWGQDQKEPEKPPCERYREFTTVFLKGFIDLAQRIMESDAKKGLSRDKTLRNLEAFSKDRDDPGPIIGGAHVTNNLRLALDFCLDNVGQVFKSPKMNMPLGCAVMVAQMMPASGDASAPADQVLLPIARGMYGHAWEIVKPMPDTEAAKRRVGILFGAFRRCYPR